MKLRSITRRLIVTVLSIEFISAVCVAGVALAYEQHAHFRAFSVLLRGRADSLLGAVQDAEDANDNVMLDGTEITAPAEDIYEVIDATGRVLGRSTNWAGVPPGRQEQEMEADRANQHDGSFFQTSVNDRTYRVIRIQGTRIVDPGDKGGGIPRTVTIYYGSSTKRVWIAVWRTVSFYAASSLLVLACTGILMSWLLNRGLAPLRDLALAASRVSVSSWTFQPPEEAHETKELAPLAMALESLLQGLQHSFEQQKRFLGDATHELKTSVAVVKSSLQLLGMKQRSAAEYQAGMKRCLSDCERMEAIVAQMLTLSRLEEGHAAEPTGYETNIIRCVREVAAAMETMAEVNGIQILIHGDPSITADVEPEQFKLLCTNLLMNALQHSTSHSDVSVDLKLEDSHAKLEISDAGEGIAPEHLPRIFERFARTDPSRARKTGGTGLGLAISQAIVVRFGGTIEIRSELNAGTTVRVQFPTLVTDRNSVD